MRWMLTYKRVTQHKRFIQTLSDSKISEFDKPLTVNQYIIRFDVPMH